MSQNGATPKALEVKVPTEDEEIKYLEKVIIPYLEKQLAQAQQKTKKLKKDG